MSKWGWWGINARSGKVRNQTPHVPKTTSTSHRYNGGRKKFRKNNTSSNNIERLQVITEWNNNLMATDQKIHHSSVFLIDERIHSTKAPNFLSNSYHNYNSVEGYERLEFIASRHEERREQNVMQQADMNLREARNHKKWHRNHPKEGFYQMREIFELTDEAFEECNNECE
ncbi:hypothetical protein C9374_001053 [Naegleria lovaniensis]|uniref:Uncharacterized protein n=1 Tax=Naegleria lovaniensis TaxID=51637 RepID=A0AA88GXI7_NAELO|nr:uncharacterized protein C9374_001053 [Naegleria lovaniensis]KAG2388203.1 hypothetical protein C9374_001053 [Naegleria lovaniensis]